eukprot:TRINITY_DN3167_c0_g1_i1.p1 TRINITY_DN3167_c0_g1~~TRINITY_DN3167_c0_g1_i1.p1  ORF type:complete len:160 (+),score=19.13 TRINITY_DN3167_c0_g1_i1:26-505(+)
MLKLSSKRARDWNGDNNISPVKCNGIVMMDTSTAPMKKLRPFEQIQYETSSINRSEYSPFPQNVITDEDPTQFMSRKFLKSKPEVSERMFTYNEVKEILARALAEKEESLRAEYDKILQEKLQDSQRNFSKSLSRKRRVSKSRVRQDTSRKTSRQSKKF